MIIPWYSRSGIRSDGQFLANGPAVGVHQGEAPIGSGDPAEARGAILIEIGTVIDHTAAVRRGRRTGIDTTTASDEGEMIGVVIDTGNAGVAETSTQHSPPSTQMDAAPRSVPRGSARRINRINPQRLCTSESR